MQDLVGHTLGHYRIVEQIGEGGMGVVYRAHDERLDRDVAIKVLPEEVAADPDRLNRFEREAKALAALNHPNIATVHGFETFDVGDSSEGAGFIPARESDRAGMKPAPTSAVHILVMELLEGEPLRKVIAGGNLTASKAVAYAQAIADGLAAAHNKGIIHRDLKPENVILTNDGRIKILDFGLAKLIASEADLTTEELTATLETSPGALIGTVAYMSPEQVRAQPCDQRADIFALGALLYEMLCGRRPFGGRSTVEIASAILGKDPRPIDTISPEVPPALTNIVARCLEKRPEDRFSSARDLSMTLGAVGSGSNPLPARGEPGTGRRWTHLLAVAIAAVIALLVVLPPEGLWQRLRGRRDLEPIESIAVLPLENLSGDQGQEFFADGMTEALISKLAQIGSIDVISKTSIMRYKGASIPLPQIARDLGVDAILEGSVMRAEGQVRITVQLIHGATDRHLWAEDYQRELSNVLYLQSDVAEAVADAIDVAVNPDERQRITRSRSIEPEVLEAYLRGTRQAMTLTGDGFLQAIANFEHAIALDPTWAPPYAGLGMVHSNITFVANRSPQESFPAAKAAAERATELDSDQVLSRMVVGFVAMVYEWDWQTAEREFSRAVELMPGSAEAHQLHSYLLACTERHEEAIAEARRAAELDPLSPLVGQHLGMALYLAKRHDEAISHLESLIERHPPFWFSYQRLALALMARGDYERGIKTIERGISYVGPSSFRAGKATLASLFALAGRQAEASAILDELESLSQTAYVPPTDLARIRVALGDHEGALADLDRAIEIHDADLFMTKVWPVWDPLRDDPRFDQILRRLNFPED